MVAWVVAVGMAGLGVCPEARAAGVVGFRRVVTTTRARATAARAANMPRIPIRQDLPVSKER